MHPGFRWDRNLHPQVCYLRYISRMDEKRDLLRHTVATLAYRTTRAIENAPESFGDFDGAGRRPVEILAHMSDLLQWSLHMAQGANRWETHMPFPWRAEQNHFYALLAAFDQYLASDEAIQAPVERLFQGPIADALSHAGQLAMLRRLAVAPICRQNSASTLSAPPFCALVLLSAPKFLTF